MAEQSDDRAITLEALPASGGDCLLISCFLPGRTWRLLVDTGPGDATGPGETWPGLYARLSAIPPDREGRRHIDLLAISHIDHDHIGACRHLFGDTTLSLTFGDIWFNGRQHLGDRAVAEGEALSRVLSATDVSLPWNVAFAGAAAATPAHRHFREIDVPDGPWITLLSPTPKRLASLAPIWDAELDTLRRQESNTPDEETRGTRFPDLEALAAEECAQNRSPTNGSSLAMLLEHRGASVLLAGDAFALDLGRGLIDLATHRSLRLPIRVDALKLSHHGSRASLVTKLFRTVVASHYVVSTNNRYGHPHDEALARVVLYGGASPTLSFNYATDHNLRWAATSLQRKYQFATRFPKTDTPGITLHLPAESSSGESTTASRCPGS